MGWRGDAKPFTPISKRPPDLKLPSTETTADIVFLEEPKFQSFGYKKDGSEDIRHFASVGYLGGNAQASIYNPADKKKYPVPAEVGEIYTIWLATTLIRSLVNVVPGEGELLGGKVLKVRREIITGGRFGSYLGYRCDELTEHAYQGLIDRIFEKFHSEEAEVDLDEVQQAEAANEDLEIAFQLVSTSLSALTTMTFAQIDNFLKSRRQSGLMKTEIRADELANYCVSKDPEKFGIEQDGEVRSLVLK